jgi:hypothetical protein
MSKRILIVGINPSSVNPAKICASIKRLYRWTDDMGIGFFSFTNCIPHAGKYTDKDIDYEFLNNCIKGYDRVVALGGFPSKALSKLDVDHFVLPHPSGLNRKLNDKSYEREVLKNCSDYLSVKE